MVGWCHQLSGHELEQNLGDSEGQGSLAHCSPWGWEESDIIEQLNNSNKRATLKCFNLITFSFFFLFKAHLFYFFNLNLFILIVGLSLYNIVLVLQYINIFSK